MIIYVSYYLGERTEGKYFENFESLESFCSNLLDINPNEHMVIELTFYRGNEEIRIRKIIREKLGGKK